MPAVTRTDKQALLATTPLFAPLATGDLEALAGVATSLRLETRKELFHKGDPGSQVYLVVDGRLKVLATSVLGDDVVFNVITPGEVIGEVALLTGSPRTATLVAMCERATSAPASMTRSLKIWRSSPRRLASTLAPMSSTP